jgi:hypothetical protein
MNIHKCTLLPCGACDYAGVDGQHGVHPQKRFLFRHAEFGVSAACHYVRELIQVYF